MPKPLTPIAIANLKPKPTRYEVSDGGCVGLRVVVFPSKAKSFVVRYRYRGQQRKLTLGPCITARGVAEPASAAETATPLLLVAARSLCAEALRLARSGTIRQPPSRSSVRSGGSRDRHVGGHRRRIFASRRPGVAHPDPAQGRPRPFLRRRVGTVAGRRDRARPVRAHFDEIADTRGPVRSDRVLSAPKTLLNWHSGRSDYVSPLVRGGKRTSTAKRARERTLTDDELRAVWSAAGEDKTPFGPYVRFVLLTATRRGEASGLRRSEMSDAATWVIPGARYKNGKDTLIPLSAAAQKIIASMPDRGDVVFTTDGARPMGSFGERKAAIDEASGVTGWTLHDLRRSARTLMSRAGIMPTMRNCVSATRCRACAERMIATPMQPRSVTPSNRWLR